MSAPGAASSSGLPDRCTVQVMMHDDIVGLQVSGALEEVRASQD
jgi:hypothetical protein